MAGEEQDRQRIGGLRERRLQLEAVHAGHLHIGEHAARRILGFARGEELRRRRKGPHREAARPQQPRRRGEKGRVVIDDMNGGFGRGHSAAVSVQEQF